MIIKRSGEVFYITFSPQINGAPVTAGVEVAVILNRTQPIEADWVIPTLMSGKLKLLCSSLAPGYYTPWARIKDNPEIAILEGKLFRVLKPA